MLGERRLGRQWGGSVMDSVVGTFLTQNVSDVLSSTAFFNLAAAWPGAGLRGMRAGGGSGGEIRECFMFETLIMID